MSDIEMVAEAPLTEARLEEILETGGTFYFRTNSPRERNTSRVLAIRKGVERGIPVHARFVTSSRSFRPLLEVKVLLPKEKAA